MAFWLWSILSLMSVIGVLLVVPDFVHSGTGQWSALLAVLAMVFGLLGVLIARPNRYFLGVKPIVCTLFFVVSIGCFGFRTYQYHANHTYVTAPIHQALTPLVVEADVQIMQLSDSPYNPALGMAYRQKAFLTNIRPHSQDSTSTNIFGFESKPRLDETPLPTTLTVLLTAPIYKSTKPQSDPLLALTTIGVGDTQHMTLRLKPILPNESSGFDSYRWLLTRHIQAQADILAVNESVPTSLSTKQRFLVALERFREHYRLMFYERYQDNLSPSVAVLLSLLTGDRALIDGQTKNLYQYGGISHLLAISGSHVLFLAIVLAKLVIIIANRFSFVYRYVSARQLRFVVMVIASMTYALFTGFEVPAVRTVLMLVFVGLVRLWLLRISPFSSLMAVALVMIAFDPYVVWQAGFWLSFVAVGLLMAYDSKDKRSNFWGMASQLLLLQAYIFLAMLPISLLLFDKVSTWGLVVNLFAVGIFGYLIVPLNLLAGVLSLISMPIANAIWWLALSVLDAVHATLTTMALLFGRTWLYTPMSVAIVLLFALVVWAIINKLIPKSLAILPLFVAVCALANHEPSPQARLAYIPSAQKQVKQILLSHQDHAWLILSSTTKGYLIDDVKLADKLQDELGQLGIKQLSGILIQNNNQALLRVAGRISLEMPTSRLLWAGKSQQIGNLIANHCQAGQTIDLQGLRLDIATGWQFGDDNLTVCNAQVAVDTPIWVDGEQTTSILINASFDETIWQLYAMMCHGQQHPKPTILMGQTQLSDELLTQLGNPKLMNH